LANQAFSPIVAQARLDGADSGDLGRLRVDGELREPASWYLLDQ
jgi:hypothetical protein